MTQDYTTLPNKITIKNNHKNNTVLSDYYKNARLNTASVPYQDGTLTLPTRQMAQENTTDLYVNPTTGNDTTGLGSRNSPYASLGKAIAEAGENYNILLSENSYTITSTIQTELNNLSGVSLTAWNNKPTLIYDFTTLNLSLDSVNMNNIILGDGEIVIVDDEEVDPGVMSFNNCSINNCNILGSISSSNTVINDSYISPQSGLYPNIDGGELNNCFVGSALTGKTILKNVEFSNVILDHIDAGAFPYLDTCMGDNLVLVANDTTYGSVFKDSTVTCYSSINSSISNSPDPPVDSCTKTGTSITASVSGGNVISTTVTEGATGELIYIADFEGLLGRAAIGETFTVDVSGQDVYIVYMGDETHKNCVTSVFVFNEQPGGLY